MSELVAAGLLFIPMIFGIVIGMMFDNFGIVIGGVIIGILIAKLYPGVS